MEKQEMANSSLYHIVSHHITDAVVQCYEKKTPTVNMNESKV